ncbi:hypothetical protein vBAspATola_01 [Aeromonas phage vB_AspA_Tola]|nr:hypothetical protein vBAspATola_01 [Aeromonas phage vB_AspA_Tola]
MAQRFLSSCIPISLMILDRCTVVQVVLDKHTVILASLSR